MGACSSSGGMFANYAVIQGADKFLPVDVHVPGCPPRPEALLYGFNKLQRMIMGNPDPGWRSRYNAHGTEEWAHELGELTADAEKAYAAAREAAEQIGEPISGEPGGPADVVGPPQERTEALQEEKPLSREERVKRDKGRFI